MLFAWAGRVRYLLWTISGLHGGRVEMTEIGHDRNPTTSNVGFRSALIADATEVSRMIYAPQSGNRSNCRQTDRKLRIDGLMWSAKNIPQFRYRPALTCTPPCSRGPYGG